MRTAVALLATAVLLAVLGTVLLAITAERGGEMIYHPYDWLGLAIDVLAAVLLVASIWRFVRH